MTPFALITKIGGYRDLAAAVGRHPGNVWKWMERGIPADCWLAVRDFARTRGVEVTLEELAAMRPASRPALKRGPKPRSPQQESAA